MFYLQDVNASLQSSWGALPGPQVEILEIAIYLVLVGLGHTDKSLQRNTCLARNMTISRWFKVLQSQVRTFVIVAVWDDDPLSTRPWFLEATGIM